MGTLRCVCNKVRIHFPMVPFKRLQCCCCDCRKGIAFSASRGGKQGPVAPDLVYFLNAMKVESGFEFLRCFLIQKGYNTRRVYATCCWTALLGDHPAYQGICVVTYNDPTIIELDDTKAALRPFDNRIFEKDMTKEELAKVTPYAPPIKGTPPDWKRVTEKVKAALEGLWAKEKEEEGEEEERNLAQQAQQAATPTSTTASTTTGGSGRISQKKEEEGVNGAVSAVLETVQTLIERIGKVEIAYPEYEGPEPKYNRLVREARERMNKAAELSSEKKKDRTAVREAREMMKAAIL
eukprot:CAMPEP_0170172460 /NCGR_PEP_ID=MMETSP0040_2-20121228/5690_1 /TAXON_ID=641309 /ORGANISM="Lotharella oceanica, Strain CCMP622" /LENGTH=293 /DNA_ID=CAMNT_0010413119 /DNA_START=174 /DNA_END=1055 /DNA_ORIENTATION=+